ncbi:MAG: hypothetical protein IPO36_10405 [Anaerolineales bacterium]|nr:hypothetical protein [Anaerolineales bacterium]
MPHKFSEVILFIILASVLLLGCANDEPEEIISKIQVSYPVSQEISKASGVGIRIELINESKYCVIFPIVTGMKIYTEQNGSQLEVENLINIIGDQNINLNPKDEIFSLLFLDIVPDLSAITITEPTQFFVSLSRIFMR